jgi:hypothetical protein
VTSDGNGAGFLFHQIGFNIRSETAHAQRYVLVFNFIHDWQRTNGVTLRCVHGALVAVEKQ